MSDGHTKWLLILGGGLMASLLVNAYFIGQRSPVDGDATAAMVAQEQPPAREPDIGEPSASERRVLAYGDGRDPSAARLEQGASGELVIHNNDEAAPPTRAPPPRVAINVPSAADDNQAKISAYFAKFDAISSNSSETSGAAYAQTIMQASMNGDTSELKKLQSDLDAMRSSLKRIAPPKACAAYHEKSLALLASSARLLADLETMLRTKDLAGLGQVTQTAQNLQSQTAALETMRKRLEGS